ncbi:MAG: 3-oxoacyl-ACP synthase III [Gammaproteobacteria bacterium]|nr:3-oxoacyl-ACP synthase III [Gammaproteobacteria bacterium]
MKYQRVVINTIAYELAPEVVSSEELEERLAPLYRALKIQAGQLEAMTGIYERRFWEPGFPVSRGAALAAEKALRASDVPPEAIECLIYGGVCRDEFEPATACHVAAALEEAGLPVSSGASVYDISNACLGMLNGMLEIANRIELGQIRAGMAVSSESSREIVDIMIERMNRLRDMEAFKLGLATLTGGSGAAAVILTDASFSGRHKLLGGITQTAPRHHMLCRWGMEARQTGEYRQFMSTDSVGVLEHGVALGRRTWEAFLKEMGWQGVDRTVCHQVGSGHRDTILPLLAVPEEHDFVAYEFLGNTGTVALPMAAGIADEREFLRPGQRVGLLGIGSGLNCVMLGAEW